MSWSYSNIDWSGTGAMVQAIGSIAAILAAIWIDQGTARRARREKAEKEAGQIRARLRAIEAASAQCELAEQRVLEAQRLSLPGNERMAPFIDAEGRRKPRPFDGLAACQHVLTAYARQDTDLDPSIVNATISAEALMVQMMSVLDECSPYNIEHGLQVVSALGLTRTELDALRARLPVAASRQPDPCSPA